LYDLSFFILFSGCFFFIFIFSLNAPYNPMSQTSEEVEVKSNRVETEPVDLEQESHRERHKHRKHRKHHRRHHHTSSKVSEEEEEDREERRRRRRHKSSRSEPSLTEHERYIQNVNQAPSILSSVEPSSAPQLPIARPAEQEATEEVEQDYIEYEKNNFEYQSIYDHDEWVTLIKSQWEHEGKPRCFGCEFLSTSEDKMLKQLKTVLGVKYPSPREKVESIARLFNEYKQRCASVGLKRPILWMEYSILEHITIHNATPESLVTEIVDVIAYQIRDISQRLRYKDKKSGTVEVNRVYSDMLLKLVPALKTLNTLGK
jgi:hypothetical protein